MAETGKVRRRLNVGPNRVDTSRRNEPGRCRWCGRRLRLAPPVLRDLETDGGPQNRGDYADNAFCGLRCGYMFAVRMAELGYHLVVTRGQANG